MYTIVDDELGATQRYIDDSEIPGMYDSGFVSAVLRVNNGVIEFADVEWDTGTVKWIVPEVKP